MNLATEFTPADGAGANLVFGQPLGGGFFVGRIRADAAAFALIAAPKAEGEIVLPYCESSKRIVGAESYCDGLANTKAMAAAGSKLAQWALDLRIGGNADWYVPSLDELEEMYFNGKPTTDKNSLYGRSGINASVIVPRYPYTADVPPQTLIEAFQAGGAEAFAEEWYWSSSQRAADSDYAWLQYFYGGYQDGDHKSYEGRARAVRRLPI